MKTADNSLQIGSILENRYHIESILGIGGFGITYKAHDDTLDCTVVIKEYLPEECGARDGDSISVIPRTNREDDYHYGLEKYLEEARVLAKFKNPNIVKVTNFIKANGTAYIIMDFEDGIALDEWLKKKSQSIDEKTILQIIVPVLKGLAEVHKAGLLHRDIKPGNIFLRKEGGPLLIDFGAARQALGEHSKSISAIISMGYAPPEQYTTRGKQGPYTDLYAVGAVLYRLITGKTPIDSVDRSHEVADEEPDPLTPCIDAGKGKVADWLCELTDQLLELRAKNRPQTAEEVLAAIENKAQVKDEPAVEPEPVIEEAEVKPEVIKTRVVKSSERFAKQQTEQVQESSIEVISSEPEKIEQSKSASRGIILKLVILVVVIAGWAIVEANHYTQKIKAELGLGGVDAMFDVALVYKMEYRESGDKEQLADAVYWLKKAAEQGHPYAQNNLAGMYGNGIGVDKNDIKAVYWYQKAADQGLKYALYNLGNMYERGTGVVKSVTKAKHWFSKACDAGISEGCSKLKEM